MTVYIISDHPDNSLAPRGTHEKDCSLGLKGFSPRLHGASLSPNLSSYLESMLVQLMLFYELRNSRNYSLTAHRTSSPRTDLLGRSFPF